MSPVEAMTQLIQESDRRTRTYLEVCENAIVDIPADQREWLETQQLAVSVVNAMLNTALPVARFRCFVEIDPIQPAPRGREPKRATHEFTVCATNILGIRSGIIALADHPTNVRVLLFEQRPAGADMIDAFQGKTKTLLYRQWLKYLDKYEALETMQ